MGHSPLPVGHVVIATWPRFTVALFTAFFFFFFKERLHFLYLDIRQSGKKWLGSKTISTFRNPRSQRNQRFSSRTNNWVIRPPPRSKAYPQWKILKKRSWLHLLEKSSSKYTQSIFKHYKVYQILYFFKDMMLLQFRHFTCWSVFRFVWSDG